MVSPTAATFVSRGILAWYECRTSTVVALVIVSHSNAPSASSASACSSETVSSVDAKLISGATTGTAPLPRRIAATLSPHGPPRGTSTRQPTSGFVCLEEVS